MLTITINDLKLIDKVNWLQYAIAPRPIALASTIDKDGNVNLSPFSFFNLFSYNPAVL
ncbi:MAG: flavin reductase family protein, partial [Parafilimonas sp.]|nr:flavin reductase family protein [Parafilimonas sp.]